MGAPRSIAGDTRLGVLCFVLGRLLTPFGGFLMTRHGLSFGYSLIILEGVGVCPVDFHVGIRRVGSLIEADEVPVDDVLHDTTDESCLVRFCHHPCRDSGKAAALAAVIAARSAVRPKVIILSSISRKLGLTCSFATTGTGIGMPYTRLGVDTKSTLQSYSEAGRIV